MEVGHGSTSAKGRQGGKTWLVVLKRGDDRVIVAIGLAKAAADDLAQKIRRLIG